ncbi:hypothetical protein GQ42DRAFT_165526 [Ramicandelaber brevisporus]|nr:hypothetical protein GQ42DRAFT_165526 [Ramicandelaber brevisporus]
MSDLIASSELDGGALQQYLTLARTSRGAAAVQLIRDVLGHRSIFVFGELLDHPSIRALAEQPEYAKYHSLLCVFAYGTLDEYVARRNELPAVNAKQLKKLRMLTIVALAGKTSRSRPLPYSTLLEHMRFATFEQPNGDDDNKVVMDPSEQATLLEELVIELVYRGLLRARINKLEQMIEVDETMTRDPHPNKYPQISARLEAWINSTRQVLAVLDSNMEKTLTTMDGAAMMDESLAATIMTKQRQSSSATAAAFGGFDQAGAPGMSQATMRMGRGM